MITKPTDEELKQVQEIMIKAKNRAISSPPKSAQQLWHEFNQIKDAIAEQYILYRVIT